MTQAEAKLAEGESGKVIGVYAARVAEAVTAVIDVNLRRFRPVSSMIGVLFANRGPGTALSWHQ